MPDDPEPTRAEIDAMPGWVLLEFGTGWCSHCRALRPRVAALLQEFPEVRHLTVDDGPGQPLGRSFAVKLWPTFVLLGDGTARWQLVRPSPAELTEAMRSAFH